MGKENEVKSSESTPDVTRLEEIGQTLIQGQEVTLTEIKRDRTWKKIAAWAGGLAVVALLTVGGFAINSSIHETHAIKKLTSLQAATATTCATQVASKSTLTIGCENHQILMTIESATSPTAVKAIAAATQQTVSQIINGVECNTRQDLVDAIAVAITHQARVTLPATAHCPAVTGK